MRKLVRRAKLVAELQPGVTVETEIACIELDRRLTAASPAPLVRRLRHQMAIVPGAASSTLSSQVRLVGYVRPAEPLRQ